MTIKIINRSNNPLPSYKTLGSAGMDIYAFLEAPIELEMLDRVLITTGLYLELPDGYEAQIRPRSGLAIHQGISIPNTPGTIDSDYRGEIKVPIINLSKEKQTIHSGDRIAQMVIAKYEKVEWLEIKVLAPTARGEGGFGSTGIQELK
ncbi:MAG: dUTP diphosphatase [Saprospiraceae bacterium]|nr:dUTP diphosphatase [Saprospiraceae bacterium]